MLPRWRLRTGVVAPLLSTTLDGMAVLFQLRQSLVSASMADRCCTDASLSRNELYQFQFVVADPPYSPSVLVPVCHGFGVFHPRIPALSHGEWQGGSSV